MNRPVRLKTMGATQTLRSKEIEAEQQFESTLSQEQLQVLEQENNSLFEGFERTFDQIKYLPSFKCAAVEIIGERRRHC